MTLACCFPYRRLRHRHGCSAVAALLLSMINLLAWLVLRLESHAWRALLDERQRWYPHLADKRPSPGDPLRYAVQTLWLLMIRPAAPVHSPHRRWLAAWSSVGRACGRLFADVGQMPPRVRHSTRLRRGADWLERIGPRRRLLLYGVIGILAAGLALLCITEPFDYLAQSVFVLLLWTLAMVVRRMPGRFPTLLLLVLSVIVSCRYLWWRYTATLNWNDALDLACGLILLAAESYSWLILMLGYVQTCWPLERRPAQLPPDTRQWPSVDLFIPTYNEDLDVVRTTVYAALGIDWPQEKLRIHLLDDGRRDSFRRFAAEVGVGYLTRPDNRHAKAGNLNHALSHTDGELVAVFDCDHVPVHSFLQVTVGWFLRDPKLALVQTPHHFFSPDPFERNLGIFRRQPNEGDLFYGLVQDGNDLWNAAFFCGSCAVLRRSALESVDGFAVETVTEDAHTALRLHRNGWNSAYLRVSQAAGLATASLPAHVGQRIRWARGMAQIFRIDNPLLGKGLNLLQRLCYANAMLHFLYGLPRLVFLTAPLAFLLLHAYIIYAPALMILLYVLPHMIHASLATSRLQGAYRKTFWGEVYETVLAWYIAWPTAVALFNPKKGSFNVTAKGGLIQEDQFNWKIALPCLVLAALNFLGLGFAVWRLSYGPAGEIATVIVSSLWVGYNLLIIGAAMSVAAEVHQVRQSHRVQTPLTVALRLPDGHLFPGVLADYSVAGVAVRLPLPLPLPLPLSSGIEVKQLLRRREREFAFPGIVRRYEGDLLGIGFETLSSQQKIDFVQCTFARADAWLDWYHEFGGDRPLRSFADVLKLGCEGYHRLYLHLPRPLRAPLRHFGRLGRWLGSYLPRNPLPMLSSPLATAAS